MLNALLLLAICAVVIWALEQVPLPWSRVFQAVVVIIFLVYLYRTGLPA